MRDSPVSFWASITQKYACRQPWASLEYVFECVPDTMSHVMNGEPCHTEQGWKCQFYDKMCHVCLTLLVFLVWGSVAFWHRTTAGEFLSCPYLPRRNRTVNGKTKMKFLPEQSREQTVQEKGNSLSSVLYRGNIVIYWQGYCCPHCCKLACPVLPENDIFSLCPKLGFGCQNLDSGRPFEAAGVLQPKQDRAYSQLRYIRLFLL